MFLVLQTQSENIKQITSVGLARGWRRVDLAMDFKRHVHDVRDRKILSQQHSLNILSILAVSMLFKFELGDDVLVKHLRSFTRYIEW